VSAFGKSSTVQKLYIPFVHMTRSKTRRHKGGHEQKFIGLDRSHRCPHGSVGRASFLTTRTNSRWWFDSPLVRE